MTELGLLGGTFDPPHNGHVALARAAIEQLPIERLLVLVVANPGHKSTVLDAETRLELARAAFPDYEVRLDEHAYTVDSVRGGRFGDAFFVVGADEAAAFESWKEPDEILRWVRLAVGTRSGYDPADLSRYGDRVVFFELDSPPLSGKDIRDRLARGEPVDDLVPLPVALLIEERGLYGAAGAAQRRG
ncbi:MAG: nicotinate-nicotinamide nucleotide adenylyltransferase [Gaiellaceae bacterium]